MNRKVLKYMVFGMNKDRQNKDSLLFLIVAYIGIAGLIIGIGIGKLL